MSRHRPGAGSDSGALIFRVRSPGARSGNPSRHTSLTNHTARQGSRHRNRRDVAWVRLLRSERGGPGTGPPRCPRKNRTHLTWVRFLGRERPGGWTDRASQAPAAGPSSGEPAPPAPAGPAPITALTTSMWQRRCPNHLAATSTWLPGPAAPHRPHRRRRLHHAHHGHRPLPRPAPHSGRAAPLSHSCRCREGRAGERRGCRDRCGS